MAPKSKKNVTRRNRQNGGAPDEVALLALLAKVLMVKEQYDVTSVNYPGVLGVPVRVVGSTVTAMPYGAFVGYNQKCVRELSDNDKIVFEGISNMILAKKLKYLDIGAEGDEFDSVELDSVKLDSLYFNKNKEIVLM